MKKTSILLASSIMILAVIVAVVGVTAAWFGNRYIYDGAVEISAQNPQNSTSIVPGSEGDLTTGQNAILRPAKIKPGLILNDITGADKYDLIDCNPYVEELHPALQERAVPVTVTFDFVYVGAPANPDGVTSPIRMELSSVTLSNPIGMDEAEKAKLVNYREEFKLSMFISTTDSGVNLFTVNDKPLYTQVTDPIDGSVYYLLNEENYVETGNDYAIQFNIIPVMHKLHATLYFAHVDECTPPELIDAQLFLNFTVTFISTVE